MIWTLWWAWLCAGLVFAIIEVVFPGFVFLGFAIGAGLVALLIFNTRLGASLPILLVIFAGLSLVAWLVLRRLFWHGSSQVTHFDRDIND